MHEACVVFQYQMAGMSSRITRVTWLYSDATYSRHVDIFSALYRVFQRPSIASALNAQKSDMLARAFPLRVITN